MRYEIEEGTHAVRIFYADSDVASLYQPDYPDMTPWESAEEAANWAQLYIASVEDELAPYAPIGRGIAGEAKPTKEERLQQLQARAAEIVENGGQVPEQLSTMITELEAELA